MELKEALNAPYSEDERSSFIIRNNREKGYQIKEFSNRLEAWGLTEEEERKKREQYIQTLYCTKRVLALILEQMGFDYFTDIEPRINRNDRARLEWELCVNVERNNPLVAMIGTELGLTKEQIDNIFLYAHGDIPSLT